MSRIPVPVRKIEMSTMNSKPPANNNQPEPEAIQVPPSPTFVHPPSPVSLISPEQKSEFFSAHSWNLGTMDNSFASCSANQSTVANHGSAISDINKLETTAPDPEEKDRASPDELIPPTSPLQSPPLVSIADKTYSILPNTKKYFDNSNSMAFPVALCTNNWTQWTVWNSGLMNLLNQDSIQNVNRRQPMINMSKEEFGCIVTDSIRKACSEFEPLGNNFFVVKPNELGLSHQNDRILYIEKFFCYSKISQKIEIGAQEVMFTGYNPESKLILKVAAHQELAQILASCLGKSDLILIRGDMEWFGYDVKGNTLGLNQARNEHMQKGLRRRFFSGEDQDQNETLGNSSIYNEASECEKMEIIRLSINDYWRHYFKGQTFVEKIVPARFTPNAFTFTYTAAATDEAAKLGLKSVKSDTSFRKKEYGKPKSFTLNDYFQRENSRRFTHQMEFPFQIPISRGVDPANPYQVLTECDNLFSNSAAAAAAMKVTPPEASKVKYVERFVAHSKLDDNHNHDEFEFITEDEDDEIAARVRKVRVIRQQNSKSMTSFKSQQQPAVADSSDRRLQIVLALISLVLLAFAISKYFVSHLDTVDMDAADPMQSESVPFKDYEDPEIENVAAANYTINYEYNYYSWLSLW